VFVACVLATLVLAVGDYLSGPYLVFATFFLVPVATAAWFCGWAPALVIAGLAAIVGVVSTALDPDAITPPIYLMNGLLRFVMYATVSVVLAAERTASDQLRSMATTDPLSALLNRRAFYERASYELMRAHRDGRALAIVYIDVDDLKGRNDTYGHEAGDAMIVEFADAARATFRSADLLARVGGDEFVMLLPNADGPSATASVERLRQRLGSSSFLPIRFSAGLVAGTVDPGADVERLVHAADVLMMDAKSQGKSRTIGRDSLTESS